MLKIWVITLFPEYFTPFKEVGVAGLALSGQRGRGFELNTVLLRNYSPKDFKGCDDAPYGGGAGMVLRADVLKNALMKGVIEAGEYGEDWQEKLHVICPTPRGQVWNNETCKEFARTIWSESTPKDLVIICGRYEGLDERFLQKYVDQEISLGDFILTGGEIPALAILDSALRFTPGVLGNKASFQHESFQDVLLEHPQYTRPRDFEGQDVPSVLVSGDHKKIKEWKEEKRLEVTERFRPDLYKIFKKDN
ncbi:MAG: tRNA (guanosine(37)-N1)-methyltransferase TrmD [Bacteriovoracaceae bacterium]|nr:tRNA (guanosine(37)-N1)-methyltransferase TrmD [Bacteriovoracaceae bacterium]